MKEVYYSAKKNGRMKNNFLNFFGLGKIPFSGTISSLISLVLFLFVNNFTIYTEQIHFSILFVAFLWSIIEINKNSEYASSDPKEIIVDEFIGMYLCLLIGNDSQFVTYIILFILFRIIDILKPFPFSAIEKKLNGKYGLLWDDIIIGSVISIFYRILNQF